MLHLEEICIFFVIYMLFSGLVYVLLPKFASSSIKKKSEIHSYYSYYISWVHAFTSLILVLFKVYFDGINMRGASSDFSKLIITHSIGYFICDSLKEELFGDGDLNYRIHHLLTLIGFSL